MELNKKVANGILDPDINRLDCYNLDLMVHGKINKNFNHGFSLMLLTLFARFIIGFFFGAIPWYIGSFLLSSVQLLQRKI